MAPMFENQYKLLARAGNRVQEVKERKKEKDLTYNICFFLILDDSVFFLYCLSAAYC